MTTPQDVEAGRVRCRSLEVVDTAGRVRAKLGNVGAPGDYAPALSIYGRGGEERVSLGLHDDGPFLSFASGGCGVVDLYVLDPNEVNGLGASHLVMSDGRGHPLVNVVVPLQAEGPWPYQGARPMQEVPRRRGPLDWLRKRRDR